MNRTLPTAVVVGIELNGLAVLRCLAVGGMPLIAADPHRYQPTMLTRHGRKIRLRALAGPELVEDLLALGRELTPRPVLFLTRDDSAATVSAHRAELEPYYRLQLPPPEITAALLAKAGFQTLAESGGFPIPPGRPVRHLDDLERLAELTYPCVLKPGERNATYDRLFAKAYRVESAEEAERLCRLILPVMPDLIVQEWIEGGDDDIYFVQQYHTAPDRPPFSFTGRKIRSWPAQIGATALCGPAPEVAAELEPLTTRFFQHCQLLGWGAMEYKRNVNTGQWRMVEPTIVRTDLQMEVATVNGCNLPLAAYHCLTGKEPLPFRSAPPTLWQRDWLAGLASARAYPDAGGGRQLKAMPVVDGYWRSDDPLPALCLYPIRLVAAGWRRLRRYALATGSRRI